MSFDIGILCGVDLLALIDRREALVHVVDAVNDHTTAWINVVDAVGAARDLGATWQQIGDMLGTSRQGAQGRFGRYLKSTEGAACQAGR